MFDDLADQIKRDEREGTTRAMRVMRMAATGLIAVLVFGGLYFAVKMLE